MKILLSLCSKQIAVQWEIIITTKSVLYILRVFFFFNLSSLLFSAVLTLFSDASFTKSE